MIYLHHLHRLYGAPLLISADHFRSLLPAFTRVLLGDAPPYENPPAIAASYSAYVRDHIAVIPVHGILTQRGKYSPPSHQLRGYSDIVRDIRMALSRQDVARIVLDIDSPGGELGGAFEAMRFIRASTQQKPIHAIINEIACSAAYGLAAACSEISINDSGICGSVGVIMEHSDFSGWLDQKGIAITELYRGDRKIDGTPYAPLTDAARDRFIDNLDVYYETFVALVSAHRRLPAQSVRATQAGTYIGQAAIDVGFVDQIASFDDVLREEIEMADLSSLDAQDTPLDEPPMATLITDGPAEAEPDPTQAAMERVSAILFSPNAERNPALTRYIVTQPSISAEQAMELLKLAATTEAPAERDPLGIAMAQIGDSGVSSLPGDDTPNTLSRAQFEQLSAKERRDFLKSSGRVLDPTE